MRDDAQIAERALTEALALVDDNQSELARICGCTQGAIWQMLNKPRPQLSIPYVLKVEQALGIPRHRLRPDIYPRPQPSPRSVAMPEQLQTPLSTLAGDR